MALVRIHTRDKNGAINTKTIRMDVQIKKEGVTNGRKRDSSKEGLMFLPVKAQCLFLDLQPVVGAERIASHTAHRLEK